MTNLILNDQVVDTLRGAMRRGESLSAVPGLILRIIREDMWRERVVERTGAKATFETFEQFVTTPPLEGLGEDLVTLRNICRDDREALDALDQASVPHRGRPKKGDIRTHSQKGTTAAQALRRLRKDRPDLHGRVLAGDLSPHRAMVQAGFRQETIVVPRDVQKLAGTLRRRLDDQELRQLRELLADAADAV